MRLMTKAATLVAIVALLPAVSVLVFTLKLVSDQRHESVLNGMKRQVEISAELLANELLNARREVELYAQLDTIKSMDATRFLPYLQSELVRHGGRYEKFIVSTREGYFYNTSGGNPAQGMLRTNDDKLANAEPLNIRQRDYWIKSVGDNQLGLPMTVTSRPMISYTTEARQVVVATTILDNNTVQGMIGVSIDWKRIVSLIKTVKEKVLSEKGRELRLFLTDSEGTYWYHWNASRIINVARDEYGHVKFSPTGQPITVSFNIKDEKISNIDEVLNDIATGRAGGVPFTEPSTGKAYYVFHAPVGQAGYTLGVVIEKDGINLPVLFVSSILSVLLISVLCSLAIAYMWNKKFILSPMNHLKECIQKLSTGYVDANREGRVETTAEFNQVIDTIHHMASSLSERDKELDQSEKRFEFAMAGTNDGLWDLDVITNDIYFSSKWCEMLGYGVESIPNNLSGLTTLIHSEDIEMFENGIATFLASDNDRLHLTFRMVHQNGSTVHILSRAFLIRDEQTRKPIRLIGTHVNITEQKAHEAQVKRLNQELEKRVQDRTNALACANKKLEVLSMQDGLTLVGNRRALDLSMNRVHSASKRYERGYSVLLIDIDFFKAYNDHYGHQGGDKALINIAERLTKQVRKEDEVFRYGGEEFLILLPETDCVKAIQLAQRILEMVRIWHAPHEASPLGYLTISIGVATSNSQDEGSVADVIKVADTYLYQAKNAGRNQIVHAA